ncbi:MAG: hypothetical protein QOF85_2222 [Solirubrobacterales bacterium]|nr:hypothetical protein [Solirubrobacterales bacterium]
MSAEYRNNHYVPQWYQRRFIPPEAKDRELFLLDLKPEKFKTPSGKKLTRKTLRRTGARRCFAIDDLYTTRIGGVESRQLEKTFFGDVDRRGQRAVEWFARDGWDDLYEDVLPDLLLFMSTQKLRTPKGLDWLLTQAGGRHREDVLDPLPELRNLYGAVWAECVWQIVDSSHSPTKFVISDHPVTVFNRSCAPGNPLYCRGANDPDIRLHGTHTIFPLSPDRLLILTNRSWACNPYRVATEVRANPDLFRDAMFNFLDIHQGRTLSEAEVLLINRIIKLRAYRFLAAGKEEWLYPERRTNMAWRDIGDSSLLMPDPRPLTPNAKIIVGYSSGTTSAMDAYGRRPGQPGYAEEMTSEDEWGPLRRWQKEFTDQFGSDLRGKPWGRTFSGTSS